MSDTPETEELKCLSLIEVMAIPQERREIALGTLRAIKERDEARAAFVIATDQMVVAQGKVREANTERDEAREEVRLLKAILDLIKKDVS
jgi:hypothetical protein